MKSCGDSTVPTTSITAVESPGHVGMPSIAYSLTDVLCTMDSGACYSCKAAGVGKEDDLLTHCTATTKGLLQRS